MKKVGMLLILLAALAAADTLSLAVGKAEVIAESGYSRLLVRFDVSQIPESSRVFFAQVFAPVQLVDTFDLDVRKVRTPWNRGHTDWFHPWHNPGGDYDTTAPGLFSYRYGLHRVVAIDITPAVQDWVNGASNYGLLFKPAFTDQPGFVRVQGPLQTLADARVRVFFYVTRTPKPKDWGPTDK